MDHVSKQEGFRNVFRVYQKFLRELDRELGRVFSIGGQDIRCGKGCSACCNGTFYISPLEGHWLRLGMAELPSETREKILDRSHSLADWIGRKAPSLSRPFPLEDSRIDEIFGLIDVLDEAGKPCPLLDENGACLLYERRPTTCRYEGIPQIDLSGIPYVSEVCEKNFEGQNIESRIELRFPVVSLELEMQEIEKNYNRLRFSNSKEWETFIPTALIEEVN